GTPTFLNLDQLRRSFGMVTDHFRLDENAELALEVDPKVTTSEQIALLGELGFNRLSLGVQDFDPAVQDAIQRRQSFEATRATVTEARQSGFRGINFDLIYGLPRQTPESWSRTLDQVVELAPDRLAIYGFAYLPELRPHQKRLPVADMVAGPAKHRLFRQAYERLVDAGYRPIGMDHFARPEDELARAQAERRLGRNFQGYTVRAARDTVAFGLTAISDLAGHLAQRVPQMKRYEAALDAHRLPIQRGIIRSPDDLERGAIIADLMCNFWADLGDRKASFEEEWEALAPLENEGLLRRNGTEIEVTPLGRFFVRNIAMVFDAYLRKNRRRFSQAV
ncbi:MAG: oxygen-independent coproporphyrinogen III oxidase, partial [Myxococcota bacterium]